MNAFEAIRSLLREIVPSNKFQTARVGDIGALHSLDDFFRKVPFTTKDEIVADFTSHPPYGSNLTYPIKRYTRFCQTSGTTGEPLSILDTPASWDRMLVNWAMIYHAAGLFLEDRIFFAFSFGPFLGFWTAFEGANRAGHLCIPGGGLSSNARLKTIIKNKATVLCCTPTYALHLGQAARAANIPTSDLPIQKIIVAGEPGGSVPNVRQRIADLWNGAQVFDHYGMTEVGPVAFQKAGEPDTLHVMEDSFLAEVIDPLTLEPMPDESIGELVLTTLARNSWPLLRYRTGDLVKRKAAPGFVLEGGIIGRSDDMVVVRGVNVFPSAVDALVRKHPEIVEYRVKVTQDGAMSELDLEIESDDATAAGKLSEAFESAFALRVSVKIVAAGSLPRFELKAKRWIK